MTGAAIAWAVAASLCPDNVLPQTGRDLQRAGENPVRFFIARLPEGVRSPLFSTAPLRRAGGCETLSRGTGVPPVFCPDLRASGSAAPVNWGAS
jgi:hypothetical protein